VAQTQKLILLKDDPHMVKQLQRSKAQSKTVSLDQLKSYTLTANQTVFETKKGNSYTLPAIIPKQAFIQVGMTHMLLKFLGKELHQNFAGYEQPPGRSSVFHGIRDTTLFDSTYNANLASTTAALETFAHYPGKKKWAVIGDMIELGAEEKADHTALAKLIAAQKFDHIILMGPRVKRYTKPALRKLIDEKKVTLVAFEKPKPVLDYLKQELSGKEVIFFKGARYLEGVIKHLLQDPADEAKLCRREAHYQKIREQWSVG